MRLANDNNYRLYKLSSFLVVLVVLCIFPFITRTYLVELAMIYFLYIILAQSYRLIVTIHDWQLYHFVLYGVGAYTSGMLAKNLNFPVFGAIPLGGIMASIVGVLITLPLLGTEGWSFYIASYGLAELIRLTWLKFRNPFGASTGIIEIPYPPVILGIDFSKTIPYYFFTLVVMLIILYLLYRLDKSHIGETFKAISIDPLLAESTGISVRKHRLMASAIGGFCAGIAGGVLVHRLRTVDPNMFELTSMLYLLIYLVVGGTKTFWGPIIGVGVMQTVFEVTRPFAQIRPVFFGLAIILVLIFMPGGIEGLIPKLGEKFKSLLKIE